MPLQAASRPSHATTTGSVLTLALILWLAAPAAARLAGEATGGDALSGHSAADQPRAAAQGTAPGVRRRGGDTAAEAAIVGGHVVDAFTHQPLANAEVRLLINPPRYSGGGPIVPVSSRPGASVAASRNAVVTRADSRGRFSFRGVPPGIYGIEAVTPGYLLGYFGYSESSTVAVPMEVRPGDTTIDADVELTPASVVTGRVLADDGRGLAGLDVELIRRVPFLRDGGSLLATASVKTENEGFFRVENVAPGEYYVRAYPNQSAVPTKLDGATSYVASFYPGVFHMLEASLVIVAAGQDIRGIDVALTTGTRSVVRGRVVNAAEVALEGGHVTLMPLSGLESSGDLQTVSRLNANLKDGRFELNNVLAGRYVLLLNGKFESDSWMGNIASQVLTVDEQPTDVALFAERPAHLEGRISLANGKPVPFKVEGVRVTTQKLQPNGFVSPSDMGPGTRPDGTFSVVSPAGDVRLSIRNIPAGWIIQSVQLNGAAVTDEPLRLTPGSTSEIGIVVTNRTAALSGVVTDRRGRAIARALVMLFPDERSKWNSERWVHTAYARSDGSYALEHVPPGDYRVVAVDSLPPEIWRSTEALELLRSASVSVRLSTAANENKTLTFSPAPPALLLR